MSVNEPLVSIYIPTHNRLNLLKRAVTSALSQSHKNIELLIVNDASSDGTDLYLQQLSKQDGRVRYFNNSERKKACHSRNIAIHNASGEYITGLDDDDYFIAERISNFLLDWNDDICGLYSHNILLGKDGNSFIKRAKKTIQPDLLISNRPGNQIFTKTRYLQKIGGFDEDYPAWQDLDAWYRMLAETGRYMALSEHASYIIDRSHGHERISENADRLKSACDIFIGKHNLDSRKAALTNLQLLTQTKQTTSWDYLTTIAKNKSPRNTMILTRQILSDTFRHMRFF